MSGFRGFSTNTVSFFKELTENNTREWFEEHKGDYEAHVVEPARAFVTAMGHRLQSIAPGIMAIPLVNQSLFRINRDTRFSADKSPYKTHMGLWMWEGTGKRMECSGFYFHLEGDAIMFAAGIYMFPKHLLSLFRDALVDPKAGKAFGAMVKKLDKAGLSLGGKHFKKTPKGFDPSHPNAEYLLYNGLTAAVELPVPPQFASQDLIDLAFEHYAPMLPLHEWLRDHIAL